MIFLWDAVFEHQQNILNIVSLWSPRHIKNSRTTKRHDCHKYQDSISPM